MRSLLQRFGSMDEGIVAKDAPYAQCRAPRSWQTIAGLTGPRGLRNALRRHFLVVSRIFGSMSPVVPACVLASLLSLGPLDAGTLIPNQRSDTADGRPGIEYDVYLPDGLDRAASPLPVVYLLHGFGASGKEWQDAGGLLELLDDLIGSGTIAPLIAVMPSAGKSWYVDSARFGGPGDYETAIIKTLVEEIDHRFPTSKSAAGRGVVGISMGGFGALRLAFKHPDVFGSVVALSPGLFEPGGLSWCHGPAGARSATRDQWYARTFGHPFDIETYVSESPFAYAARAAASGGLPNVMLAVGDDDYFGSYDGTVEMFLLLRQLGQKPELRVSDGGHDWTFWRSVLPDSLRFLNAQWAGDALWPPSR